jgi:hypothetical protein
MAEFTDAIIKIVDKKIKTIETAELDLYGQLNDVEKIIFEDLKKAINKLNVEGGTIQFDEKNIDLVNSLDRIMIESIQSSTMPSAITKYLRNFQTISEFNFDVHKDVNDLSKSELEKLVSPVQKLAVETTLNGLTGSGVNTNFIEPVRQGIFQNIVAGTNRTQLEQYLSNYVLGNPNVDGLYSRYVKQVTRDALNQFDGQTNARIADEFGLDAFRYVGSLIDDSRPQCIRWVGKRVLQKTELQSEINWANNNGTGMISGTTPNNFSIYRGGYNCRHAAIPFKLTNSQKKRLEEQDSKTESFVLTNQQQVSEFLKKAAFDQNFLHATDTANVDSIKKNGFSTSKTTIGKMFGNGVYLTDKKSVANNYAGLLKDKDVKPTILNLKTNVKKPFFWDQNEVERLSILEFDGSEVQATKKYLKNLFEKNKGFETLFNKIKKEFDDDFSKTWEQYGELLKKDSKEAAKFYKENLLTRPNSFWGAMTETAKEFGFDSFFYQTEDFGRTGGQQLIVFNPKNIKILEI